MIFVIAFDYAEGTGGLIRRRSWLATAVEFDWVSYQTGQWGYQTYALTSGKLTAKGTRKIVNSKRFTAADANADDWQTESEFLATEQAVVVLPPIVTPVTPVKPATPTTPSTGVVNNFPGGSGVVNNFPGSGSGSTPGPTTPIGPTTPTTPTTPVVRPVTTPPVTPKPVAVAPTTREVSLEIKAASQHGGDILFIKNSTDLVIGVASWNGGGGQTLKYSGTLGIGARIFVFANMQSIVSSRPPSWEVNITIAGKKTNFKYNTPYPPSYNYNGAVANGSFVIP